MKDTIKIMSFLHNLLFYMKNKFMYVIIIYEKVNL